MPVGVHIHKKDSLDQPEKHMYAKYYRYIANIIMEIMEKRR